jgi:SAM-dependent methyltransferase
LIDYSSVTEATGVRVTREAAVMLYTRYAFASPFCEGKDVLEVGCGPGTGLGYLAKRARKVVGGDLTEPLIKRANSHYKGQVPLLRLDAQMLPFRRESFDVVILFEAIYFLARPGDFLTECTRVLRPGGVLLICLPNRERQGFNPSPWSTQYFSATELQALFSDCRFEADMFGAFPTPSPTLRQELIEQLRKTASRLDLIPRTMHGKEFLKRLFYGRLVKLTDEIEGSSAEAAPLIPLSPNSRASGYKVLYAVARPRFRAATRIA